FSVSSIWIPLHVKPAGTVHRHGSDGAGGSGSNATTASATTNPTNEVAATTSTMPECVAPRYSLRATIFINSLLVWNTSSENSSRSTRQRQDQAIRSFESMRSTVLRADHRRT